MPRYVALADGFIFDALESKRLDVKQVVRILNCDTLMVELDELERTAHQINVILKSRFKNIKPERTRRAEAE